MKSRNGILFHSISGQARGIQFLQLHHGGPQVLQSHHTPVPRQPDIAPHLPEVCSCKAFRYCDQLYQGSTSTFRTLWRRAATRPQMSAYDLYMHECLTLVIHGQRPPDVPGPNGGYSALNAIPGTAHPGLEICGWTPPPPPPTYFHCPGCQTHPPNFYAITIPYAAIPNWPEGDFCFAWMGEGDPCTWTEDSGIHAGRVDQHETYAELLVRAEGTTWNCLYFYRAGGNDCAGTRTFSYHHKSGTCHSATPPSPIIAVPQANCESGGGGPA